jgi:hypothetical protein
VNYASAAGGILDETGQNLIGRILFNQQIANFEKTLEDLTLQLGSVRMQWHRSGLIALWRFSEESTASSSLPTILSDNTKESSIRHLSKLLVTV